MASGLAFWGKSSCAPIGKTKNKNWTGVTSGGITKNGAYLLPSFLPTFARAKTPK
jgi:hypothetical protein